jgi:hypothetical protein
MRFAQERTIVEYAEIDGKVLELMRNCHVLVPSPLIIGPEDYSRTESRHCDGRIEHKIGQNI